MANIEIEHLGFCYQAHGSSFRALGDISLTIDDGAFVCVIGPSGCGKTTLLRVLAGLQPPTCGQVRIDGAPVEGPGTDRAFVFQNYTLFPWMTAEKNVQFAIKQAQKGLGRQQVRELATDWLQKVGMAADAGKYPYQLSGGMRQRVAIARALAMDSEILLLDEPFGALDARIRLELQALLEALWQSGGARRKTVVFVTHDIKEAVRLGDRILFMQPGRVGGDIDVGLPRPRDVQDPAAQKRMREVRQELMALFYHSAEREGVRESE